jgi:3-deoxy-7-phosphoheptulonate synthase
MSDVSSWRPDSWTDDRFSAEQQPQWPDREHLARAAEELRSRPPLIYAGEARVLKAELARVANGEAFVLQAGDCAETFDGNSADRLKDLLKVLLQVSVVLTYSSGVPVVKIGRVAGQFAKPRSAKFETTPDGVRVEPYRGDIVNRLELSEEARRPNPDNMLLAYEQATRSLNLLRSFTDGGFADLAGVHQWNRDFVASSTEGRRYEAVAAGIDAALRFMKACKIDTPAMHSTTLFSSHEALLLPYEEALTRQDSTADNAWYDCSAHMLWIGTRTKKLLTSAHVEFLSGVGNPIGIKIGGEDYPFTPDDLIALCDRLDRNCEPGRLSLISRMGAENVKANLPPFIEAVEKSDHTVVWACDPMHGNTISSEGGLKTRRFDDVFAELTRYFEVHREMGTWPGGIHLELTGDNVTECLGGSDELRDDELHRDYQTACDPRLNARQSLDLAFRVAELLHEFQGTPMRHRESPEEARAKLRVAP